MTAKLTVQEVDGLKRLCPICNLKTMVPFGEIRTGPRAGRRKVYKCKKCNYQSMVVCKC